MGDDFNTQLARKLLAACMAQRMGNKSIDYTMKHYIQTGAQIDGAWIDLAKQAWKLMESRI